MARRGGHASGSYFRGGGDRQRLGGEGGVRLRGGDMDAGILGVPGQFTDTPIRVGGRFRRFAGHGSDFGGRRFRRSFRRR